jgi:hypothetical protein
MLLLLVVEAQVVVHLLQVQVLVAQAVFFCQMLCHTL